MNYSFDVLYRSAGHGAFIDIFICLWKNLVFITEQQEVSLGKYKPIIFMVNSEKEERDHKV